MAGLGPTLGQKGVEDAPDLAVIDRDEALLRKDQSQPAVRADIFDLGQTIVPGVEDGRQIAKKSSIITVNHRYRS